MLSRIVIALTSRKAWLLADPYPRPSPRLELLRQSYVRFSSDRQILATEIPFSDVSPVLAASKTDGMREDDFRSSQSEVILESLRRVAASRRFKHAKISSETEALFDALTRLGLEKHIRELNHTRNLLPVLKKVQLLVSEAVSTSDMKTLLRRSVFLNMPLEKFGNFFYLLKRFLSTGENAGKVLANNSKVLLQSIEHLEMKFKLFEEFEVDQETRLTISLAVNRVLSVKKESLHKRLTFLKDIGLSYHSRNRMLRKFPRILMNSVEASLQPTIDLLQSRGMDKAIVLKLLTLHPEILVSKSLAMKLDLLRQLGFTTEECVKAIGRMFKCSCKFILSRCDYLKNQGFSDDDVSLMIRKYPFIMSKSEEDIKRRVDYFVNVEKRDLKEIVKFPPCLGYSLEQRIIPRFTFLREMGILDKYSMSTVLTINAESFKERFMIPKNIISSYQDAKSAS